jgi:hypothetical protein
MARADGLAMTHSDRTAKSFWARDSKQVQPQRGGTILMQLLPEGTTGNAHCCFICSLIFLIKQIHILYCHMKAIVNAGSIAKGGSGTWCNGSSSYNLSGSISKDGSFVTGIGGPRHCW